MKPLESGIIVLDKPLGIEEVVKYVNCISPSKFLELPEDEKRIVEEVATELPYNDIQVNFVDYSENPLTFRFNLMQFSYRKAQMEGKIRGEDIDPAGVEGVLECQDGIVAGRRPTTRLHKELGLERTIQNVPGGSIKPIDFAYGKSPILEAFYRQLNEEVGLSPENIRDLFLIGFSRDIKYRGFGANFCYNVPETFEQVRTRWLGARDSHEYGELFLLQKKPEEIIRYMLEHGEIIPHSRAGLALYGRKEWGTDWFNELIRKSEGRIVILSYM